ATLRRIYSDRPPAIVAPDIILKSRSGLPSSNHHQNPCLTTRPSKLRMRFIWAMTRNHLLYTVFELLSSLRYRLLSSLVRLKSSGAPNTNEAGFPIYAPFGAFVMFHKDYFTAGGTLRYPGFLFGEEIYVGETARTL